MDKTFSSNIEIKPSEGINLGEYNYKDNTLYNRMIDDSRNENSNVLYTNSSTFGNTIYYFNGKDLKYIKKMEALNYLDNIIKSDGYNPNEWNNLLYILKNDRSE